MGYLLVYIFLKHCHETWKNQEIPESGRIHEQKPRGLVLDEVHDPIIMNNKYDGYIIIHKIDTLL